MSLFNPCPYCERIRLPPSETVPAAPINSPNYHMGMDFLALSFVVVVVGGIASLPDAVLAGVLAGILKHFAFMAVVPDTDTRVFDATAQEVPDNESLWAAYRAISRALPFTR